MMAVLKPCLFFFFAIVVCSLNCISKSVRENCVWPPLVCSHFVFSSSFFNSVIVCCNVFEFLYFSELPGITKKEYEQNFWFHFAFNLAIY